MAFEKLCTLDDVWEGEMEEFTTATGRDVLVVCIEGGRIKAFQSMCPHQEIALIDGSFEGGVITCKAHLWQFDSETGAGLNPTDCRIAEYPVDIRGDDVFVNVEGVEPCKSHT
ncbi:Rieske 2Fe-2S domain-containing protein [Zavarzinia compransoris]|uniref:2Fe-2S ferredoxin n=1 Tax=Zavarzinia compransoris TaxID=1264899 RepID=A0A317DT32_9PROT|nr:Rieske 2Fe-2S domain-containing protein [Zavarzinia compransoris]PWR17847.1 2Fe-2S ferredoxin [Zavarzinia compransoris]TDP49382.1 toluene 4-monooxygenase protein C [Zavarzinia compransoris]